MSIAVAVHITTAILSVILGTVVLLIDKGTLHHRLLGGIWAVTMLVTALSSFGTRTLNHGHFSWVHGLSLITVASITRGVWAIWRGDVRGHTRAMRASFVGLVLAGIGALATPHRLLNLIATGWIA